MHFKCNGVHIVVARGRWLRSESTPLSRSTYVSTCGHDTCFAIAATIEEIANMNPIILVAVIAQMPPEQHMQDDRQRDANMARFSLKSSGSE